MWGRETHTEELFGALLGGFMAALLGVGVLILVVRNAPGPWVLLTAALVGLTSAVGFMLGGAYTAHRRTWLSTALLFAAGFTALWSVALSLPAEPRWPVLVALALAIVMGLRAGRVFRRPPAEDEAAWTR